MNWVGPDGSPAFRYQFELERHPGIAPEEHPHFLAYRQRGEGEAEADLVWDSASPDTSRMRMEPGQLEDLQWVFTKPGTYVISVHLQGYVRQAGNALSSAPDGWTPLSGNGTLTETSEVKRYVIQVGDELDETEPPRFGININVDEPPVPGSSIGPPIPVHGDDMGILTYTLSGEASEKFALVPSTSPNGVQIVMAQGASFDLFHQKHFTLRLDVTNSVDHEGNPDPEVDDWLQVDVRLTYPWVNLIVDETELPVSRVAALFAQIANIPDTPDLTFHFVNASGQVLYAGGLPAFSRTHYTPATETIRVYATYVPAGGDPATDTRRVDSHNSVTITWTPR